MISLFSLVENVIKSCCYEVSFLIVGQFKRIYGKIKVFKLATVTVMEENTLFDKCEALRFKRVKPIIFFVTPKRF